MTSAAGSTGLQAIRNVNKGMAVGGKTRLEEWRHGLPALLAAMAGLGVGVPMVINCAGLFVVALERETGWARAAVSFGPMIGILYALMLPVVGARIERWGAERTGFFGLIALAVGLFALAALPLRPVYFYGCIIWLSMTGPLCCNVVFCRVAAPFFARSVGTAIAVLLTGVSITAAVAQPLLAAIIDQWGWRAAIASMGAASLLLGALPVYVVMRPAIRRGGSATENKTGAAPGSAGSGISDPRFWALSCVFAMAAAAIGGFVAQIQPIMVERGFGLVQAASITSSFLMLTAVGRLLAGMMFDVMEPRRVAFGAFALSAVGTVFLLTDLVDPLALLPVMIAVGLIGLAQGAEGDFMALFTLRIFGLERFAFLFACLNTMVAIGFSLGGIGFAFCHDLTGSYHIAIVAAGALLAIATGCCAMLPLAGSERTVVPKS